VRPSRLSFLLKPAAAVTFAIVRLKKLTNVSDFVDFHKTTKAMSLDWNLNDISDDEFDENALGDDDFSDNEAGEDEGDGEVCHCHSPPSKRQ
jgi:hypothetical protein